jgi:hypothetical protein
VRGVVHIHSRRSDGTGTIEQIASAAAKAGLSFVIITDHGDATREPERPVYHDGVLCIDAIEIGSNEGHVVALGLPKSPYPLGGETRDIVTDIARLGGMSIAAHPTSRKKDLRWRDWAVPVDGLEWLNGDSEWRDEPFIALARALLTYPVRKASTLAALLDRPEESLHEWDALASVRPVVGIAGSDAHARIGLRGEGDPFKPRIAVHLPSYEQAFKAFSISLSGVTLSRDPAVDAKAVVNAIRQGHVYSTIDGLAGPAVVTYTAKSGEVEAQMGDTLPPGKRVDFHLESNAPPDSQITLFRDGRIAAQTTGGRLAYMSEELGTYRAEIVLADSPGRPPIPWVVTNPIYVRNKLEPATQKPAPSTYVSRYQDGAADGWRVEKSAQSEGSMNVVRTIGGTQLTLRFALGGGDGDSPYVGLAMPAGEIAGHDRLAFTAAASRPMRVSVQLRVADAKGERWQRSVYLDETARGVIVPFDEMRPVGATSSAHPVVERVRDVLFVIDTANAHSGSNGQLWIDDVKYGH